MRRIILATATLGLLGLLAATSMEAGYMPTPGRLYISNNLYLAADGSCTGNVGALYGIDLAGTAGLVELRRSENCGILVNFTKLGEPQTLAKRTVISVVQKFHNPQTDEFYNPPVAFALHARFVTDIDGCPRGTDATASPETYDTYEREYAPAPILSERQPADCRAFTGAWWTNDNGNPLDGPYDSHDFNAEAWSRGAALNPECNYVPEGSARIRDAHTCSWYPGDSEPDWSSGDRTVSDQVVPALTQLEIPT